MTCTPLPLRPEYSDQGRKSQSTVVIYCPEGKSRGEVKGCTCVSGSPQQEYIRQEDAASPTVATNSVLLTGTVDAHQGQDYAFIDLPETFLHIITDEMIIMTLQRELCKLMCLISPRLYHKYVCKDKRGRSVLYIELYK